MSNKFFFPFVVLLLLASCTDSSQADALLGRRSAQADQLSIILAHEAYQAYASQLADEMYMLATGALNPAADGLAEVLDAHPSTSICDMPAEAFANIDQGLAYKNVMCQHENTVARLRAEVPAFFELSDEEAEQLWLMAQAQMPKNSAEAITEYVIQQR